MKKKKRANKRKEENKGCLGKIETSKPPARTGQNADKAVDYHHPLKQRNKETKKQRNKETTTASISSRKRSNSRTHAPTIVRVWIIGQFHQTQHPVPQPQAKRVQPPLESRNPTSAGHAVRVIDASPRAGVWMCL